MKNKLKVDFKDKKTIIISILIGLILIGLIIFICTKIFHKDKELTPDNPTVNEFENYLKDAIKPFDEDSIKDYIDSTNNIAKVAKIYWGANYTGNDYDTIKILYTLSRLFYDDSDLIDYMVGAGMFDEDTKLGEVKLSIKFINKALAAKFKNTEIKANTILNDGFFKGVNAVFCDNTMCTIVISTNPSNDTKSNGLYRNDKSELIKTGSGYELSLSYYYYELSLSGAMDIKIYDNAAKEKTICEASVIKLYFGNFDTSDICDTNTEFKKVKYYFDKDYRYIKSEAL